MPMLEYTDNCLPMVQNIQETKNSHVYFSQLPDGAHVVVKRAKITGRDRLSRYRKEVALLQQAVLSLPEL